TSSRTSRSAKSPSIFLIREMTSDSTAARTGARVWCRDGTADVTPDEFGPLGMSSDEMDRAHAAIRRLTRECIDVTRERLRRGERPNLTAEAPNVATGIPDA